ncbi:Small protein A [Candidatus Blochmanniella vafra str. BVAF]|uniref:Small protein A n=1 Tax=Blochmanniella vafra (strain BVAF) TaxID=859654 RepID=E8Q6G1_BLOVB|nr:Small protein A [Candidatus Blochmannia vafer str. BVAF]
MDKKPHIKLKKKWNPFNRIHIYYYIWILLNSNCSSINQINYHLNYLNTKQGSYLQSQDIQKIRIGMTKSEILSNIGITPTLKNCFGSNIWYYIYHQYINGKLQYQTVILTFNNNDILTDFNILNNIKKNNHN